MCVANQPPTNPGTSPGLPAIAYAIYPESTAGISVNDATPMSRMSFSVGEFEKSGPLPGIIGAQPIATAIMIPPQAMNGIANETPLKRYCRSLMSDCFMQQSDRPPNQPPHCKFARPMQTMECRNI